MMMANSMKTIITGRHNELLAEAEKGVGWYLFCFWVMDLIKLTVMKVL